MLLDAHNNKKSVKYNTHGFRCRTASCETQKRYIRGTSPEFQSGRRGGLFLAFSRLFGHQMGRHGANSGLEIPTVIHTPHTRAHTHTSPAHSVKEKNYRSAAKGKGMN